GDDLLFQLFLGRHTVSTDPNRGRPEKLRRLHSGCATGKTDCRFSRFYNDATNVRRCNFPDVDSGIAKSSEPGVERAHDHSAIFWRHKLVDHRGRHARYHATGGDSPDSAALRRILAQG